jgi:hypothetical protein
MIINSNFFFDSLTSAFAWGQDKTKDKEAWVAPIFVSFFSFKNWSLNV